jgi:hypothetical protein
LKEIPNVKFGSVREGLTATILERRRSGPRAGTGPDDGENPVGRA